LCKHFRRTMGQTPAAWRRAHSGEDHGNEHRAAPSSRKDRLQTKWFPRDAVAA
jgi:hypothetical protein